MKNIKRIKKRLSKVIDELGEGYKTIYFGKNTTVIAVMKEKHFNKCLDELEYIVSLVDDSK